MNTNNKKQNESQREHQQAQQKQQEKTKIILTTSKARKKRLKTTRTIRKIQKQQTKTITTRKTRTHEYSTCGLLELRLVSRLASARARFGTKPPLLPVLIQSKPFFISVFPFHFDTNPNPRIRFPE